MGIGPSTSTSKGVQPSEDTKAVGDSNGDAFDSDDNNSQLFLEANSAEVDESADDFQSIHSNIEGRANGPSDSNRERKRRAENADREKSSFARRSIVPSEARKAEIIAAVPEETKTALDERTLKILKKYLESREFEKENLEEDDVVDLSIQTCQYANERTRYRQNLLEETDMADSETFYDRVYKKEEFYALANEFLQTVSYEVNSIAEDSNTQIDTKTLRWVKRAAGLQRPYDPLDHQPPNPIVDTEPGDSDTSGIVLRRLTRGMARNTRVKRRERKRKKETEGLNIIKEAIEELEKERGEAFPETPLPNLDSDFSGEDGDSKDECRQTPGGQGQKTGSSTRGLIARIRSKTYTSDIHVKSVLVQGKHVKMPTQEEILDSEPEFKRKQTSHCLDQNVGYLSLKYRKKGNFLGEDGDEGISKDNLTSVETPPSTDTKDPLDVSFSEWIYCRNRGDMTELEMHDSNPIEIPQNLAREKIELQLQKRGGTVIVGDSKTRETGPARKRPHKFYAMTCGKVINLLGGRGRDWTRYEFFYSDLDWAWYNFDSFASDISKLGIRASASLTRREWSAIRRRLPRRSRRFSRKFITSELKKRNRYRSFVRRLQEEPNYVNTTGLDIPLPIQVGATVTAYSKKIRVIHRGVVMHHDRTNHGYLIRFEQNQLGCEFCPDSDVASHGSTPTHIHGSGFSTVPTNVVARRHSPGHVGPRSSVCDAEQSPDKTYHLSGESNDRHDNAQATDPHMPSRFRGYENESRENEREILVTLSAVVGRCLRRKRKILDGIEELGVLEDFRMSANYGAASPSPQGTKSIRAWLLSSLLVTEESLESARLALLTTSGEILARN